MLFICVYMRTACNFNVLQPVKQTQYLNNKECQWAWCWLDQYDMKNGKLPSAYCRKTFFFLPFENAWMQKRLVALPLPPSMTTTMTALMVIKKSLSAITPANQIKVRCHLLVYRRKWSIRVRHVFLFHAFDSILVHVCVFFFFFFGILRKRFATYFEGFICIQIVNEFMICSTKLLW